MMPKGDGKVEREEIDMLLLDNEWVLLMAEAKQLNIAQEEVRLFLKDSAGLPKHTATMKKT